MIIMMASFMRASYMLVFHQSKYISAIKRILFYYRHVYILVFFHVFMCSLLLRCMLKKSSALRVGVKTLHQWFPTFLISRPHSKLLHKRSAPDITYNSEDVQITTDKIKSTIILHVRRTVFKFLCKTNSTYANQWDDWACSCVSRLEILGVVSVRTKLLSIPTSSSPFLDFCFNVDKVENPASQTGVGIRIWASEANPPKTAVEGPQWYICTIVLLYREKVWLASYLNKCDYRLVRKLFNRTMQKPVFFAETFRSFVL